MSIHGINGSNNPLGTPPSLVRPNTARTTDPRSDRAAERANVTAQPQHGLPTLKPQAPIAGQAASQSAQAVPAEAPPGTDPTLWGVLTTEERTFFAKTAAMGPLTYGRIKAATNPAPPAARGIRLDVRA